LYIECKQVKPSPKNGQLAIQPDLQNAKYVKESITTYKQHSALEERRWRGRVKIKNERQNDSRIRADNSTTLVPVN
jgi:hypothetical protein